MQNFYRTTAVVGFLVMLAVVGCGVRHQNNATGPKTVRLRGKVVFTKGGDVKSLFNKQARVELESVDQPTIRAVGPIEEDGGFTVATITPEGGNVGAVPGKHRVRLDLEENARRLVAPQFLDFAKSGITIQVPADDVVVQVWR